MRVTVIIKHGGNDVQARYDKFVGTLYQYLTISIDDFASIKPRILDIFKTHRPIKVKDYIYGVSKAAVNKRRLIVHEISDNRSMVREYFNAGRNAWHCCECVRTGAASAHDDLVIEHGIIFVQLEHQCKPREFSFVMKVQEYYQRKNVNEADALQRTVLGSEDINKIYYQKNFFAGKSVSSASPSNYAKLIPPDTCSNLATEKNENVEGLQSLNMGSSLNEIRCSEKQEASFAEIIEHLEEYTSEKKDVIMSNKAKILHVLNSDVHDATQTYLPYIANFEKPCTSLVLKTCRPMKLVGYQYGYGISENLHPNERIIVFEWDDKKYVREYSKRKEKENLWNCRQCLCGTLEAKTLMHTYLSLVNDIVFVQIKHDCKPRIYSQVMKIQECLQKGDVTRARSIAHNQTFSMDNKNVLDKASPSSSKDADDTEKEMNNDENNSMSSNNLKRNMPFNDNNNKVPKNKKPKSRDNGCIDLFDSILALMG